MPSAWGLSLPLFTECREGLFPETQYLVLLMLESPTYG
jgi:hypothetical protein